MHDAITHAKEEKRERQIDEDTHGNIERRGNDKRGWTEGWLGGGRAYTNPTKYWLTSGWQISLATHPFGLQLAAYTEPNAFEYHLLLPILFVMLICCQPRRGAQLCLSVGDRFRLITVNEVCKFNARFILIRLVHRCSRFPLVLSSSDCFATFATSLREIARDYLVGLWLFYQHLPFCRWDENTGYADLDTARDCLSGTWRASNNVQLARRI